MKRYLIILAICYSGFHICSPTAAMANSVIVFQSQWLRYYSQIIAAHNDLSKEIIN